MLLRAEQDDPDFDEYSDSEGSDDGEASTSVLTDSPIHKQKVFLVYESQLLVLLKRCIKCGSLIPSSAITEVKNTGSQLTLNLRCSQGTFRTKEIVL